MMMKYVLIMENPVQRAYFQFLKHIDIFSRSCNTGVMLLFEYYLLLPSVRGSCASCVLLRSFYMHYTTVKESSASETKLLLSVIYIFKHFNSNHFKLVFTRVHP